MKTIAAGLRYVGLSTAAAMLVCHAGASHAAPATAASFAAHQAQCAGKDGWSDPAPPVRIFANIYDIGTCGIVVLLVTGPAGHIVIDAATAEAVPSIVANIQRLGFRPSDVKLLLSSHEHLDHAGGMHALQLRTGAKLIATAASRRQLESGIALPDDPQKRSLPDFAGSRVDRVVRDGEIVRLQSLQLTAHVTPGHAPGSTSWSWRSCEGAICHAVVYADSLSAVSADDYRFTDHPAYAGTFRATIAKVAALSCDLVITPHPAVSYLYERLSGTKPLADPAACANYAAASAAKLDARLASER
jgi:metallo-beta-lactamase class B